MGVKSTINDMVSPSLYAVLDSKMVATGLFDLAIENLVLEFACCGFRRIMAKSMASLDVVGSEMEDARRICLRAGMVGESSPFPPPDCDCRC